MEAPALDVSGAESQEKDKSVIVRWKPEEIRFKERAALSACSAQVCERGPNKGLRGP